MKAVHAAMAMLLLVFSLGAGPVWYEPAAYTGEAIERAIANAYRDIRGRVFLPGGTYIVSRTIAISSRGPLMIEGAAQATPWTDFPYTAGVKLEWHGPKDQPMIRMNTQGVHLSNMMLDGRGVASHGIVLANSPSVGSSMNRYADMILRDFTVACFQAGEKSTDGNCADTYFDRVLFSKAPSGFRSVNDQSVNNHFTGCGFGELGHALDIERGGAVTVIGGGALQCDWVVRQRVGGHNCGPIHIDSMKVENSGYKRRFMGLVDSQPQPGHGFVDAGMIRLTSVWMAGGIIQEKLPDDEVPLFLLGPGAQVIAEGCMFKPAGARSQWPFARLTGSEQGTAILRARDSYFMGDVSERTFITEGDVRLQIENPASPNAHRREGLNIGSR